jgi:Sec1 family
MEREDFSLYKSFRYRVLNEIFDEINHISLNYILIVDKKSLGIISGGVSVLDLTERGVTVIEKLEKSRKPLPEIDALYFISPTHQSIKLLSEDFTTTVKYNQIYLYFTSHVPDSLMTLLAASPAFPYIRAFKEANCGFRILGSDSFSLECPGILGSLYMCNNPSERRDLVKHISKSLANVCGVMRELPYVSYQAESLLAQEVALSVEEEIEGLYRKADQLIINDSRPVMIILDRNYDLAFPLVHDVHYEALLKDLYEVGPDGNVTYSSVDNSNLTSTKEAVINEFDELWVKLRYQEIDEAQSILNDDLITFRDGNRIMENNKENDLKSMSKVVSGLSGYNQSLKKFAVHKFLINACIKLFADENITELSEIEQMILTGFDSEKKEYKESDVISKILKNLPKLKNINEKLRLCILAIVGIELSPLDRKSIIDLLSPSLSLTLTKLSVFGISLQSPSKTRKRLDKKYITSLQNRIPPITKLYNYAVPKLFDIITSAVNNTLKSDGFNFGRTGPPSFNDIEPVPKVKSLRKKQNFNVRSKRKVILFVIGGVAYSELRLVKDFPDVQVAIGGTRVFSPLEFVQEIVDMSKQSCVPDLDPRDIELDFR